MSWQNPQQQYPGHHPPPPHQGYGGAPYQPGPPHGGPPPGGPPHGGPPPGAPPHGAPQYSQYPPPYNQQQAPYGSGPSHSYGQPPPAQQYPLAQTGPPPGVDVTLWEWFKSVDDDKSGQITAVELRQALVNSNWSHFNEETCRLLIGMFDKDRNGSIDIYEFGALWKYIQEWKGCFDRFDRDRSGNISAQELQTALSSFGYRVSINFCQLCTRVFDRSDQNSMKFDDFIQCCVMLKALTESFKRLDTDQDGVIDVNYEQFLEMAIDNTIINK